MTNKIRRLSSCACSARSLENHHSQSKGKQKSESKKLKGPFQLSAFAFPWLWLQARKSITMVLSHPSATTTLIFNPYLPLVGRLLDVLLTYGPPETAIETCNRTLAQLAHCSAGAIPAALRRLEADGYIERVVTTHGSLITVAAQILERNPQLTIAEFETMCQIAQARRGVENGGIGLVFWCLLNNEPLYTPKELRSERRYSEHQRPNGPEPRAGGNNRRGWHCRPNQVLAA